MSTHLSLTDRTVIERLIAMHYSFSYIARELRRSPSTIAREVLKRRTFTSHFRAGSNDCIEYFNCLHKHLCPTETKYTCFQNCKFCTEYNCTTICEFYISEHCPRLEKPPYVCTSCKEKKGCRKVQTYYSAFKANHLYLETLRESRMGPHASPEELKRINDIIAPLLQNGQSLNHILSTHSLDIRFTERTIYNYIDLRALSVRNIDLPKKVAYKMRRTKKVRTTMEYQCRKGRTIDDFKDYIAAHPDVSIVEMDTVKGTRGSKNVLLTFIFRENNFMLIFLMNDGTQKSVNKVFDYLTQTLGLELFKQVFPVILTDNGVEFKGPHNLEFTADGKRRTRIFYCDPLASWQKAHIEKNHSLIRRILPKGTTFNFLTPKDIHLITCHINSVAREIFDNVTPFDLMTAPRYKKLLDALALSAIPPDEVCLKPILLKRR